MKSKKILYHYVVEYRAKIGGKWVWVKCIERNHKRSFTTDAQHRIRRLKPQRVERDVWV